jgi:glutamate racemase
LDLAGRRPIEPATGNPPAGRLGTKATISLTVPREMPDLNAAQCWHRAEACRRLVELAESPERKTLWAERADHWVKLALEAEKQPPLPEATATDEAAN